MLSNWDGYFLFKAATAASKSKDPSTKCGAVIVDPIDKIIISEGYNGFPRFVDDDYRLDDREQKYKIIIHADANAILHARTDLRRSVMYLWPFPPCSRCAGLIVQAGLAGVVAPMASADLMGRWGKDNELAREILSDAAVSIRIYDRAQVINSILPFYDNLCGMVGEFWKEA